MCNITDAGSTSPFACVLTMLKPSANLSSYHSGPVTYTAQAIASLMAKLTIQLVSSFSMLGSLTFVAQQAMLSGVQDRDWV